MRRTDMKGVTTSMAALTLAAGLLAAGRHTEELKVSLVRSVAVAILRQVEAPAASQPAVTPTPARTPAETPAVCTLHPAPARICSLSRQKRSPVSPLRRVVSISECHLLAVARHLVTV